MVLICKSRLALITQCILSDDAYCQCDSLMILNVADDVHGYINCQSQFLLLLMVVMAVGKILLSIVKHLKILPVVSWRINDPMIMRVLLMRFNQVEEHI
jgi:hypothetical protein